jgi:hypothetical protein
MNQHSSSDSSWLDGLACSSTMTPYQLEQLQQVRWQGNDGTALLSSCTCSCLDDLTSSSSRVTALQVMLNLEQLQQVSRCCSNATRYVRQQMLAAQLCLLSQQ